MLMLQKKLAEKNWLSCYDKGKRREAVVKECASFKTKRSFLPKWSVR